MRGDLIVVKVYLIGAIIDVLLGFRKHVGLYTHQKWDRGVAIKGLEIRDENIVRSDKRRRSYR